jgi:hypothetical protein
MPPRLPIIATIWGSWTDAMRAIRAMPVVSVCALVLHAAVAVGTLFAIFAILLSPGRTVEEWLTSPAWFAFSLVNVGIRIILLAPLFIAIHRFVIRGEIASRYPLHPLRPSYLKYIGTAFVLFCVSRAPDLISVVLPLGLPFSANLAIAIVTFALMGAVAIVVVRKIALFPAIAVNAPNASWGQVAPADAGNVARILIVLAGVLLPFVIVSLVQIAYLPLPGETGALMITLAMALVQLPVMCAFAAAMARIYLAIGTSVEAAPVVAAQKPATA